MSARFIPREISRLQSGEHLGININWFNLGCPVLGFGPRFSKNG
jgi:hypothetical protein